MPPCSTVRPLRDGDVPLELQLVEVRFDTGTHETYQLLVDNGLDALADPNQVRELVHLIRSGAQRAGGRRRRRVRRVDGTVRARTETSELRARSAPSSRTRRSSSTSS